MSKKRSMKLSQVFAPLRALDADFAKQGARDLKGHSYSQAIYHTYDAGRDYIVPPGTGPHSGKALEVIEARRAVFRNIFTYACESGQEGVNDFYVALWIGRLPKHGFGEPAALEQLLIDVSRDTPGTMTPARVNALLRHALDHQLENLVAWIAERGIQPAHDFRLRYFSPGAESPWQKAIIDGIAGMIDARNLEKAMAKERPAHAQAHDLTGGL